VFLIACGPDYTPKQKGYNRIDLPVHSYDTLKGDYPYQFNISSLVTVRPHKSPYATKDWIDLEYYDYNAEFQVTYIPITSPDMYESLVNDAYKLTSKHQVKASSIEMVQIRTPKGYAATIYELDGDVPSQIQFTVSDSTKHFLRAALYFRTATKNDSLAPVITFIKEDAIELINSLEWKN
jgi:gliding motility-associated lipoprotein GldD